MDTTLSSSAFQPAYLRLVETGELEQRVQTAYARLARCELCAVRCRANRLEDKRGGCRTGLLARVSSYGPHFGEERPLVGRHGSGTVFFAGCNLRCQYCQNWEISQSEAGGETQVEELAAIFLDLQAEGCHNINLVSPSHVVPQILAALLAAARAGLRLPLVYNTGGYDSVDTLRLLDGVIDIYMPDMKYSSPQIGRRYSKVISYPAVNQAAVREMYRQVGNLQIDERGIAQRGLLVRHLVLPNHIAGTQQVAAFLANEISPDVAVNIMDQYRPEFQAHLYPSLNRRLTHEEYIEALQAARQAGLKKVNALL